MLNGYLLTLASLILLGGSLGDRFGRRRVFVIGVWWFTAASLLCAVAPSSGLLVAARMLQGVGGALLTPGSLAMIEASFRPSDRATAIGAWSGLGGIVTAIGPLLGGLLVSAVSWRAIFVINLPLGIFVALMANRHVPETRDPDASGRHRLPRRDARGDRPRRDDVRADRRWLRVDRVGRAGRRSGASSRWSRSSSPRSAAPTR